MLPDYSAVQLVLLCSFVHSRAVWKVVGPLPKNPDGALWYQQAVRQLRAFSSQLQISPLSSGISKPNQAKLMILNQEEVLY